MNHRPVLFELKYKVFFFFPGGNKWKKDELVQKFSKKEQFSYVHSYVQTYFDQKVPGIHLENSKYKFYSSKVILSPSKYSPSTTTYASA